MEIFEMEKEFDALMKKGQELIEKMKKEQVVAEDSKIKRWKPKDGETYWYIYGDGTIDFHFGVLMDDALSGRYKLGNCFKTKEEAQKEVERRVVEQELLDLADWESDECAEIVYDFRHKEFSVSCFCTETCYSPYRFASKESAQKAIDTLGEDKLKLIFRID